MKPVTANRPVLSLRNIKKAFGGIIALENFNLDLFPGEVVALVGDNGAGKSTLLTIADSDRVTPLNVWILG